MEDPYFLAPRGKGALVPLHDVVCIKYDVKRSISKRGFEEFLPVKVSEDNVN